MKKINKLIFLTAALLLSGNAFADDFGDFEDFGSFDDSDSFSGSEGFGSGSALEAGATVSTEVRGYVGDLFWIENPKGSDVSIMALPKAVISLKYNGSKSDAELKLRGDEDIIKNHPVDVIDELVLRGYFGNLTAEAGKMKIVWGKGDKLHVIDNFNADDYTDFIIPDYLDRRISTPMLRAVYSMPFANMNIEAVYTPLLPTDRFSTDGRWAPAQAAALTDSVTKLAKARVAASTERLEKARTEANQAATLKAMVAAGDTGSAKTALSSMVTSAVSSGKIKNYTTQEIVDWCVANGMDPTQFSNQQLAGSSILGDRYSNYVKSELTAAETEYTLALANANSLSANPNVIYPNLWTLQYSQFGGRATWTAGMVDMGISYYNGWFKQPSVNAGKIDTFLNAYLKNGSVNEDEKFLAYDKKQTFGVEASTVLWHFNLRGEGAFNLTDDTEGTNPWVHNNSIGWLGGFDIDLPFWNSNLNVQEYGTYILHGSDCDANVVNHYADVDYSKKGVYSNNKFAINFTTSFLNGKVAPEVTFIYGIEYGDFVAQPKIIYKPADGLSFIASGMVIVTKDNDSEFAAWKKNSFASISAEYKF